MSQIQKTNSKLVDLNLTSLVIILNVKNPNMSIKWQRLSDQIIPRPNYMLTTKKSPFKFKNTNRLKVKIQHVNKTQKRLSMAIPISKLISEQRILTGMKKVIL